MTEDVTMFERILNRIAENSEANRQLRADMAGFKNTLAGALGDAAPEDASDAAALVAGVKSLRVQLQAHRERITDGLNRITELTNQRATAYDAERDALKLVADLELEKAAIAEALKLIGPEMDAAE